ncbi:unnamed protein product, partial [Mesorhabditis belari]|uniref:Uncharacterized protein n=1 Tax=Mesorhabditis belari TaxID=2138241 RepID=A0AAF3F769_9BILA
MVCGQKYLQLGVDQERKPVWKEGIISERRDGYYFGTSQGGYGDSGSGIFDMGGRFIGSLVAKTDFALSDPKIDDGGLADHHPETRMISSILIFGHLRWDDDPNEKFSPTETKQAA